MAQIVRTLAIEASVMPPTSVFHSRISLSMISSNCERVPTSVPSPLETSHRYECMHSVFNHVHSYELPDCLKDVHFNLNLVSKIGQANQLVRQFFFFYLRFVFLLVRIRLMLFVHSLASHNQS